jgi:hypothetical protein
VVACLNLRTGLPAPLGAAACTESHGHGANGNGNGWASDDDGDGGSAVVPASQRICNNRPCWAGPGQNRDSGRGLRGPGRLLLTHLNEALALDANNDDDA